MNLQMTSSKAAGNPGPAGRVQIADQGPLWVVTFTTAADNGDLLTRLHEAYLKGPADNPYEALNSAVAKTVAEFSTAGQELGLAAAVFINGVLYTAVSGQVQAGVLRQAALAKILSGKAGETISASGYPKEGDLFILATNEFFNSFSEVDIKVGLVTLAPRIQTLAEAAKVGVLMLHFSAQEEAKPKLSEFISQVGRKIPRRRIVIRNETPSYEETRANKKAFSVGLILLFLLATSIFFGVQQNRLKEKRAQYVDKLVRAERSLDESGQLFSLDKQRARELFLEAKTIVAELKTMGIKDNRLEALNNSLKAKEGEVLAEYQSEAVMFLDLSLIVDNFSAGSLAVSGSKAVFLDAKNKKGIEVDIESKRAEALDGIEKVDQPQEIAVYSDKVYLLTDTNIVEVGDKPREVLAKDWQQVLMKIYGGNIYLLDRENSLVYRFPGSGESFGAKQLWLAPGIKLDLSKVIDWTIDGAIWLAFADGRIMKLSQGSPVNIQVASLEPPLNSLSALYSNEELKGVYLLDKANSRLIVIDKNGDFLAQYKAESLNNAGGLIVSEKKKQALFLLGGNKLYSIELKHLK